MFPVLVTIINSLNWVSEIKNVTVSNWNSELSKVNESTPYLVLFYANYCPYCRAINPHYNAAAKKAYGMFSFGAVNIEEEKEKVKEMNVRHVPALFIFHDNTYIKYHGSWHEDDIIHSAAKYIPEFIQYVNTSWKQERDKRSVILFTKSKTIPILWSAIAHRFNNDSLCVRVGVANTKAVYEQYYLEFDDTSYILFLDGVDRMDYYGKFNYKALEGAIECFFLGEPQPIYHMDTRQEFYQICHGDNICVFAQGTSSIKALASLREQMVGYPFLYATATRGVDLNLKPGIWAISNTNYSRIKLSSWRPKKDLIDIFEGRAKWID